MSTRDFYVVLPSNVICEEYPNNRIGQFSTAFPQQLPINDGEWEGALVEMSFPITFFNITQLENSITMKTVTDDITRIIGIPSGYHKDGIELTNKIDSVLTKHYGTRFKYDKVNQKVHISLVDAEQMTVNDKMAAVLGFGIYNNGHSVLLDQTVDLILIFPEENLSILIRQLTAFLFTLTSFK